MPDFSRLLVGLLFLNDCRLKTTYPPKCKPGRLLIRVLAINKNGIQRLAAPPTPDLSKFKTDKKITDEEILKILEQPIGKAANANKNKNRKKRTKKPKKADAPAEEGEEESGDGDEE